ncbi:MAG TPA: ModE family transcriptional regulator [Halothiobacillaceae bacterium]|nr:ModE family transcriptional regulator [Halothiobacillaceae bacterium]
MPRKSRQNRLPGEPCAVGINLRFWLVDGYFNRYLGVGKVRLIKAIDALGSISREAFSMAISYKPVWSLVEKVNQLIAQAFSVKEAGGGHAWAAEQGQVAIAGYQQLEADLQAFLAQRAQPK